MGVKLSYHNTAAINQPHSQGTAPKTLAVLHETVSPDEPGWADINSVEAYLASIDYGIHGMTDLEGHMAWAYGCGNDIFWQAGGVNTESIGIEQVSNIPTEVANKTKTIAQAYQEWIARDLQLHATAKILAAWNAVDPKNHVLTYVDGSAKYKGVTTHWDVSQFWPASDGHTDCWPHPKGGYYPVLEVIEMAQTYAKLGYHF